LMMERDLTTLRPEITGRSDLAPIAVTIAKACDLSGFGPTSIWAFLRDGRLEAVRVPGIRRTLVSYRSLAHLLTPATNPQPAPRRRGRPRKSEAPASAATTAATT
jgi:hypothetical protein